MAGEILRSIDVQSGPPGSTRFTAPNWVLLFLILGGIGINSLNIYILQDQLEDIRRDVDRHMSQPSHADTARIFNELFRRLEESERRG